MPFTYLAHQFPVMPLKAYRPRWFSGSALLIGSAVPDFEYLRDTRQPPSGLGHSLIGQFIFCLPITLLLVVWLSFLLRPLVARLPHNTSLHLEDLRLLCLVPKTAADWLKVVCSALVGSVSHVLLDGFTHRTGWIAKQTYAALSFTLFGIDVPVPLALQYVCTFGGSIGAVWLVIRWLKTRIVLQWITTSSTNIVDAPVPTKTRLGLLLVALCSIAGGVFGAITSRPWLAHPELYFAHSKFYVIGFVLFRSTTIAMLSGGVGLTMLAIADHFDLPAIAFTREKNSSSRLGK